MPLRPKQRRNPHMPPERLVDLSRCPGNATIDGRLGCSAGIQINHGVCWSRRLQASPQHRQQIILASPKDGGSGFRHALLVSLTSLLLSTCLSVVLTAYSQYYCSQHRSPARLGPDNEQRNTTTMNICAYSCTLRSESTADVGHHCLRTSFNDKAVSFRSSIVTVAFEPLEWTAPTRLSPPTSSGMVTPARVILSAATRGPLKLPRTM